MPRTDRDWLDNEHPIYAATKDIWEKNERRLRGGEDVLVELRRFEWETLPTDSPIDNGDGTYTKPGEHYLARQDMATYINFPAMFSTAMLGHINREAPFPDNGLNFGTMGAVRRVSDVTEPSQAEQVYYNCDGTGSDGSQWDNYWSAVAAWAQATGHRWIYVDVPVAPPDRRPSRRDELDGLRPYLVDFSPLAVPDWHFVNGVLQYAIVILKERNPRIIDGKLEGKDAEKSYLLFVRAGFAGLGDEFAGGGWWKFDKDKDEIVGQTGKWDDTDGEIPFFPLYYQRDKGLHSKAAISRPALTEIGQAAVAYMNLSSAADFDAWDAATSILALRGVDEEGYTLFTEKIRQGSRYAPLPSNQDTDGVPEIQDASAGAVVADVFDKRMNAKRIEARELSALEASSTPESSGLSKQAGFLETKAPRLALIASEIEAAQNIAIYFLERRFGATLPTGSVIWPRDFNLVDVVDTLEKYFALQTASGIKSKTLAVKAMTKAGTELGLITDDAEADKVRAEFEDSANQAAEIEAQEAASNREFGLTR